VNLGNMQCPPVPPLEAGGLGRKDSLSIRSRGKVMEDLLKHKRMTDSNNKKPSRNQESMPLSDDNQGFDTHNLGINSRVGFQTQAPSPKGKETGRRKKVPSVQEYGTMRF